MIDLDSDVDELDLPVRAMNTLAQLGVRTVRDLLTMSPDAMMSQRNFGKRSLKAIRDAVHDHGWRLADEEIALATPDPKPRLELAQALKKAAAAGRIFADALWRVGAALEGPP